MAKTAKTARKAGKVRVTAESRSASKSSDRLPSDVTGARATRLGRIQIGNRELAGGPKKLGKRTLNILPDMPDIRDRFYQPSLRALHTAIFPRLAFSVRDQGDDSSCTGFSLAHVVDVLQFREIGPDNPRRVSARMLYEMAKRNDEWAGSAYEGSSIRGAIKGFFRNGACSEATAPDVPGSKDWALTYEMAKEARETRLGAYFRLQPDLSDYHAALNDAGVIFASAQIHSNWEKPLNAKIVPRGKAAGGHAFAIVGYNDSGFWVLNSWGPEWGQGGVAHWSYEDWAATIMDAWVLQLGVRAPNAFGAMPRISPSNTAKISGFNDPHRADIIGHFINIDDGRLVTDGKYGSPTPLEMNETVSRLTTGSANSGKGYDHLVIYAHGGLNSLPDEAKRIATWKRHEVFSRNRLYNFHLMWGSGFIDEIFGKMSESPAAGRMGAGAFDWLFEAGIGKELGSYAWRNMKQDARVAFDTSNEYGGGFKGLLPLLSGLDRASKRPIIHLVGHSAGSIVLGYLLSALTRFKLKNLQLGSIQLMAPACTVGFFKEHYGPYLSSGGALKLQDKLYLYNLNDTLELDDTVSSNVPLVPSYSHSLLYLVSRAYEDKAGAPLAGMQKYVNDMPTGAKLEVAYSKSGKTASLSHGGFDNDVATMSSIMSRVAGGKLEFPPTEDELSGY